MHSLLIRTLSIAALTLLSAGAIVAQDGTVGRTAITLLNGTQEIMPDTTVARFSYNPVSDGGLTTYRLNALSGDHVVRSLRTDSIVELTYGPTSRYEHFAGIWWLVASPNGEPNEQGIMVTETVSVPVHAVLPAPGTPDYGHYIYCHIDSMPHRSGLKVSADFKLHYTYDEALGRGTIAMVLDDSQPISDTEYAGDPTTYAYFAPGQTWYMGASDQHQGGDTGHRYMYFVSQNIDTQQLEGMEIATTWTDADQQDLEHEYRFAQQYQIYWIAALDIPYSNAEHDEVGIIDIFASPRLMRHAWHKPLKQP